jgi:glycosyltransferase involved in cell wall biosynthesis
MPPAVIVDAAGGQIGGAARFKVELHRYIATTGRDDVRIIGANRQLDPGWLVRREFGISARRRRIALNNVSFVGPGSERWALLRNPLDFITEEEEAKADSALRGANRRRAAIVHLAARRADVLVVPTAGMAKRVTSVLPRLAERIVVRHHPVTADSIPHRPKGPVILCPVLFSPYKGMTERITELVSALDGVTEPDIRLQVTANNPEVPETLVNHPRIDLVGRIDHRALRELWARSSAIYFPPGIESFGYPLAEARVNGQPVIAPDTEQNREVAGSAICGFKVGDTSSLQVAIKQALTVKVEPDPAPFDPTAYFDWLLGRTRND